VAAEGERAIGAEVVVFENVLEFGLATLDVPGLDGRMVAQTPSDVHWQTGGQAHITARPDCVYLFDVTTGDRIR
jgi:multiple sugar transport system ATP-binding protein